MKLRLSPDVAALNGLSATVQADASHAAPKERRKRGEGTGSREGALNALAAAGWCRYSWNGGNHTLTHRDGRERTAGSYDALLDKVLAEIRG